jgi:hypothetical protein
LLQGIDDLQLLTPLYTAVAISPVWILQGKLPAVRGTGKIPLHGLVQAAIAPKMAEGSNIRQVEKDLFRLIIDMAISGPKDYHVRMGAMTATWCNVIGSDPGTSLQTQSDAVAHIEDMAPGETGVQGGDGHNTGKMPTVSLPSSRKASVAPKARGKASRDVDAELIARREQMKTLWRTRVSQEKQDKRLLNPYRVAHRFSKVLTQDLKPGSKKNYAKGFFFDQKGEVPDWMELLERRSDEEGYDADATSDVRSTQMEEIDNPPIPSHETHGKPSKTGSKGKGKYEADPVRLQPGRAKKEVGKSYRFADVETPQDDVRNLFPYNDTRRRRANVVDVGTSEQVSTETLASEPPADAVTGQTQDNAEPHRSKIPLNYTSSFHSEAVCSCYSYFCLCVVV